MIIPTRRMLWLAALPIAAVFAGQGGAIAVVVAWSLLGAVLILFITDGVLAGGKRRVSFEREAPTQLHVDQPNPVSWIVENLTDSRLALLLSDRVPEGSIANPRVLEVDARPRSRTKATFNLVPSLRGPAAFGDLDYRIRGPLGLAWTQKRFPNRLELRCLPHLANAKAAELAERRALLRQAGSHRFRWRGAGSAFESLREYSVQDDMRWVDWKATARMGRPISRNFEVERHQQVMVMVDASRALSTFCGRRTKFDAMLEAGILVARSAINQGDGLGLLVFADKVDAYLHPSRERAQLKEVIENLYDKRPLLVEPNFELALTLAAKRNRRRTLFILLTDVTILEAARRMQRFLRILSPVHLPLVVTIADETVEQNELVEPRTTEEFYRVGVANELMYERTLILEELRRSGVEVVDARADQVATRVVERYLDLKRRLRL